MKNRFSHALLNLSNDFCLQILVFDEPKFVKKPEKPGTSSSKFDIIIFGASGFVGRHTVLEAVTVLENFKWGVAGRDKKKLQNTLGSIGAQMEIDLSGLPIIIASIGDQNSLVNMTQQCKVLVNCCGPYQLIGEAVIKACLAAGTHYVDVCNEPNYMESMQLKYHKAAEEKNVYIVSACGFKSLPMDLGVKHFDKFFDGTINSIDAYTQFWNWDKVVSPVASSTVWASIILACADIRKIPLTRQELRTRELPDLHPKSSYKGVLHDSKVVPGVCVPLPLIDQLVVERSQYYFYERNCKRPVQFHNYLVFPAYIIAVFFLIWYFVIVILAQMEYTRCLLLKYPRIFSINLFANEGPDVERMKKTFFRITLHAVGWSEKAVNANHEFSGEPCKFMKVKLSGINPPYGFGCVCLLTSAITILTESENMPSSGGVFTPAAAFENTKIMDELEKYEHGLCFQII